MKRIPSVLAVLVLAASAGWIGYLSGREGGAGGPGEEGGEGKAVEAGVKVAPARMATMDTTVVAYGVVRAAPEGIHLFSVPFEARVRRFLVTPGQTVAAGTALLEADPSPATLLQEEQAKSGVESAGRMLAQAKHAAALQKEETAIACESAAKILAQTLRRVEMKLGTAQELLEAQREASQARMRWESLEKLDATPETLEAQQNLDLARLQLESLEKLGIHAAEVRSEAGGVVNAALAQEGQIVPAGGPLIELAEENRIEARLGVEPDDCAGLREGQPVRIQPVLGRESGPVEGHLRRISHRVNPTSRLVEICVSLPSDSGLLLESYVRGTVTVGSLEVLTVPRSAVLPGEEGAFLFTIANGKAVKHAVRTGPEDDTRVGILGDGLKPDDLVVVEGNYELEDGMPVVVEQDSTGKN